MLKRPLSRDIVLVSGFTLATQGLLLASQFVFATVFGASLASDAFFAAFALPLYASTVLISSLAVVFLPAVIERRAHGSGEEVSEFVSGVINLCAVVLTAVAIVGVVFADPLIALTAPGLPAIGRDSARVLAMILWPSILGSGLIVLLTVLWQADSRFGWSAAAAFLGAAANLVVLALLAPVIGPAGAAIAWTGSAFLQALLLTPGFRKSWRPTLALDSSSVRALFVALAPLLIANVFIRASTVVERYLGSQLSTGELSHVTYASRVIVTLAVLMSAGPIAVIFPRMAWDLVAGGVSVLRSTVSQSLRSLWVVVAPVVALLVALADPGVRLVFEHGEFTRADSDAVTSLLRLYAPSLIAAALAGITGRAIYALKATKVLAVVGSVEGIAYVAYTTFLASRFGAPGIAVGFTIYYLGSLAWQLLYLRRTLHASGRTVARSFVSTSVLAVTAGILAWLGSLLAREPLVAVLSGGALGLVVYAAGFVLINRLEGRPDAQSSTTNLR